MPTDAACTNSEIGTKRLISIGRTLALRREPLAFENTEGVKAKRR
jgi:hypothetical protein